MHRVDKEVIKNAWEIYYPIDTLAQLKSPLKKLVQQEIPKIWISKNKEFQVLHKTKNTRTKRYRKNVDQAYDNLDQIVMFIQDYGKLKELSPEINKLVTRNVFFR